MINHALYTIIFNDDTKFIGGTDYREPKWEEIPCNKKIRRIFYRLPDGNYLTLGGYDDYYHMIESTENIIGKDVGKRIIRYAYIMGRKNNTVTSYRITLFQTKDSRYKIGDIVRREYDINSEKITGLNVNMWR